MYSPKPFLSHELEDARQLIRENGFATVLSFPKNDLPFINHIPVIFSPDEGEDRTLIGHMSKRNPQWMHFKENAQCVMLIHGPHTYITPTWYKSGRDVPTWSYAVAHLYGRIQLVENFEGQVNTISALADYYEKPNVSPWKFELPADLNDSTKLTNAIISFRFEIEKVEAKFKFSQTRPPIDQQGVLDGLAERQDEMSHRVRAMMLELSGSKS